jgi:gliding motility-associated-like protein
MRRLFICILLIIYYKGEVGCQTLAWAIGIGGTPNNEQSTSTATDANGNIYTVGHFSGTVDFDPSSNVYNLTSFGSSDIFITKTSPSGAFIWANKIGNAYDDYGQSVCVDLNNNIYLTGYGKACHALSYDIVVYKFTPNGSLVWSKCYGGDDDDRGYSIKVDSSGNSYIGGIFTYQALGLQTSGQFDLDGFVMKLDPLGNFSWAKQIGGIYSESVQSIAIDSAKNIYVTGLHSTRTDFDPGPNVVWLNTNGSFVLKLDSLGNYRFVRGFSSTQDVRGYSISIDNNQGIYASGVFSGSADFDPTPAVNTITSNGDYDIYLLKLDFNGSVAWVNTFGSIGPEWAAGLCIDSYGNLISTGRFKGTVDFDPGPLQFNLSAYALPANQNSDAFILKLSPQGQLGFAIHIGGDYFSTGTAINVDRNNNIIVTGNFQGLADFDPSIATYNLNSVSNTSDVFILKLGSCTLQQTFNPLPDTTRICGLNAVLSAPGGFTNYSWNTSSTSQSITVNTSGTYKVTVTDASGCSAVDSSYVSITNANIINNDTVICRGSTITLSIDSLFPGANSCTLNQIPVSARSNLVAYYPFCGNANDVSGNANHGTVYGSTLTNDRFGNSNSAYSFNGNNNYIQLPNFQSRNITVSMWAKINSVTTQQQLLRNRWGGYGISMTPSSGIPKLSVFTHLKDYAWTTSGVASVGTNSISTVDNQWHHIVFTYDSLRLKMYLDNQYIGADSAFGLGQILYQNSGLGLAIGRDGDASLYYFNGLIDDVMFYNRALTGSEVSQLYSNTSVQWSTGSTSNQITVSPTQTTTYYVTISNGITACIDSVKVTISTVDTTVTSLDPTSICSSGGTVRLQAGLGLTYQWLRNNIIIPGANTRLYTATQTGSYRVVMSNSLGCIDTSRAIQVTVNPQPIPSFTVNRSSQCKNGNSFIFTNTSTISSGTLSYAWSFGDGNTSTALRPTYSYAAAGTYVVKLVVTSNNGCRDSITQTVSVLPSPTPGFIVNNLTQCLSVNSFIFTNTSTITPGTLSYSWNFGNGTTSTATNPTISYSAAGTHTVTLIATSNSGCIDSIRQNVVVNSNASGSISTPTSTIICEGGSVTLSASGGTTYQWALNGANIAGATNPTYSASLPGVYSVQINNASGCSGTSSNTIALSLVRRPTADFTSIGSCASFPVIFTNQSTVSNSGIVTYSWAFGNGSTSTNVNPTAVYSSPGNYNVTLIVTPQACPALSSSITKPITVISATANQRYTSLNAVANRNLQLQARTFTGASYQWIPPSGLNSTLIVNPIFNSNRQQEYLIKISTPDGCVVTDTLLVRIFDGRGIYLPKGFTPNGDGNNDKLTPRLVGISRLIFFKVYDRWGQLMYQTSIAGEGWDGTFKGVKQPIETYTWVAEGIDIDGNTIRETGNSMLLR